MIPLTGVSSLFKRLGREIALVNKKSQEQATGFTVDINTIFADYSSTQRDVVNELDGIAESLRGSESGFNSSIISIGQQTLQRMAADDLNVDSLSLTASLNELQFQMEQTGNTIGQPTISATANSLTTVNQGNGVQLIAATTPNGLPLIHSFNEVFDIVCTSDYFLDGGGSQGVENFQLTGQPAVDSSSFEWPKGSGVDTSIQAAFSQKSSIVADSSFENWNTDGSLVSWPSTAGTFGTTIVKTATDSAQNGFAGSWVVRFVQSANASQIEGNLQSVSAATTYAFAIFCKLNNAAHTGKLTISLKSAAAGGTTLTQDNGFPCAREFTINNTNYPAGTWVLTTGFFSTPTFTPNDGVKVAIRAESSGSLDFSVDTFCLLQMTPLYPGGPQYQIFSGYTPFRREDRFRFTVSANNNTDTFSRSLDRFWSLRENNVRFPYTTGTPTISNSLITLS